MYIKNTQIYTKKSENARFFVSFCADAFGLKLIFGGIVEVDGGEGAVGEVVALASDGVEVGVTFRA